MSNKFGICAILVTALSSPMTLAAETGGGCGVGKIVMEGKSGKNAHIVVSLINIVINQFFPHQLFGMTSGTLGCDTSQEVMNGFGRETFVAENTDNLSVEMAQGEGEHLASLANMMGVEPQDEPVFYSALQDNFQSIVTADDMLASIDSTLTGHPQLAKYVR